jgi:hypothetical protein
MLGQLEAALTNAFVPLIAIALWLGTGLQPATAYRACNSSTDTGRIYHRRRFRLPHRDRLVEFARPGGVGVSSTAGQSRLRS